MHAWEGRVVLADGIVWVGRVRVGRCGLERGVKYGDWLTLEEVKFRGEKCK